MRRYRTAIFVNGCFWHGHEGCRQFVLPKTNTAFWQAKIDRNRERDRRNYQLLLDAGWQVIVIWACNLTKDKTEPTMQQVAVTLNRHLLALAQKKLKKVAFKVIDSDSFLTYIWRGIYKHKTNNILSRI